MALTRSRASSIFTPQGNSLAVFIDVVDGVIKLKDVFGNISTAKSILEPFICLYASFSSTQTQSISANQEKAIEVDTTDITPNGISLVGNSKFKVSQSGIYNVAISAQVIHTTGGTAITSWWFKVNNNIVENTTTDLKLQGNGAEQVFYVNVFLDVQADDEIEIFWSSTDSGSQLYAIGERISPIRPKVPSVIITINSVSL
jgi:hypothetical protein